MLEKTTMQENKSLVPPPTTRMAAVSRPRQTFLGVQALRGVAAALVVVYHGTQLWSGVVHGYGTRFAWPNGAAGVDVFFVISGFVMATVATRGKPTPFDFLSRRLLRIAPMYWIASLLSIGAIVAGHRHAPHFDGHLQPWHVVASFLFIPSRDASGQVYPILAVGWTLSYEMFFYGLFSLALAARKNLALSLTLVMLPLSLVGAFYSESWPAMTVLLQPIILEFLAGVFLAYALRRKPKVPALPFVFAGVIGFAGLLVLPSSPVLRPVAWGIPAFVLVASVVFLEERLGPRVPRWLLRIGDASYSLYLLHVFAVNALVAMTKHFWVSMSRPIFCVLALSISIAAALIAFRYIEAPITLALANRMRHRPPGVVVLGDQIEKAGESRRRS